MSQERALAEGGMLQQGANVGRGQMIAAGHYITPNITFLENDAGETTVRWVPWSGACCPVTVECLPAPPVKWQAAYPLKRQSWRDGLAAPPWRARSRLYIARALLQGATVPILDESFAALDPATLHLVQQCVLAHAPTLLVIAHP